MKAIPEYNQVTEMSRLKLLTCCNKKTLGYSFTIQRALYGELAEHMCT